MPRFILLVAALAVGCKHHQANQYAYAPPLAPPVYPQPQVPTQPVAYPTPAGAAPGAIVAPQAAPADALPPGAVIVPDGAPCPPLSGEVIVGTPVVYESDAQTPPCPPGP